MQAVFVRLQKQEMKNCCVGWFFSFYIGIREYLVSF